MRRKSHPPSKINSRCDVVGPVATSHSGNKYYCHNFRRFYSKILGLSRNFFASREIAFIQLPVSLNKTVMLKD